MSLQEGTITEANLAALTRIQQFSEYFSIHRNATTKKWILYYDNIELGIIVSLKDLLIHIDTDISS